MSILKLALYWSERYKRSNEECEFTNTNPYIILAFVKWIKNAYGIAKYDLILSVSINESHKSRLSVIARYWSYITEIPLSQFTRSSLIKNPINVLTRIGRRILGRFASRYEELPHCVE